MHEEPAKLGIYFGYPSYQKTIGNTLEKHQLKVGVFVSDTNLSSIESSCIKNLKLNLVAVPSMHCKKMFNSSYTRNIMVVNHGVAESFMPIGKERKNTFGYVFQCSPSGGSEERKNIRALLQAFAEIRNKHQDWNLVIKTTSNIKMDLDTAEEKNEGVKFDIRFLPIEKMVEFYNSLAFYINPTRAEGFGITPVEAMACGTPVISPIHTGCMEYLNETNCVPIRYVPEADYHFKYAMNQGKICTIRPNQIVEAINTAINNRDLWLDLAQKQSEYVRERFSWQNVMKGFLQWVREQE